MGLPHALAALVPDGVRASAPGARRVRHPGPSASAGSAAVMRSAASRVARRRFLPAARTTRHTPQPATTAAALTVTGHTCSSTCPAATAAFPAIHRTAAATTTAAGHCARVRGARHMLLAPAISDTPAPTPTPTSTSTAGVWVWSAGQVEAPPRPKVWPHNHTPATSPAIAQPLSLPPRPGRGLRRMCVQTGDVAPAAAVRTGHLRWLPRPGQGASLPADVPPAETDMARPRRQGTARRSWYSCRHACSRTVHPSTPRESRAKRPAIHQADPPCPASE